MARWPSPLGPIGLIILAIAGVIAIAALLIWKWDEVKAKTQGGLECNPDAGWIKWRAGDHGGRPLIGLIFTTGLIIEHWDKSWGATKMTLDRLERDPDRPRGTSIKATWERDQDGSPRARMERHPGRLERHLASAPGSAALAVWNGVGGHVGRGLGRYLAQP